MPTPHSTTRSLIHRKLADEFETLGCVGVLLCGALAAIIVLFIFVVVTAVTRPAPAPAFSEDVRAVVETCAESHTSAAAYRIGDMTTATTSTDADGLLRCLYANGVTVNFHGDPVEMDTSDAD